MKSVEYNLAILIKFMFELKKIYKRMFTKVPRFGSVDEGDPPSFLAGTARPDGPQKLRARIVARWLERLRRADHPANSGRG